MSCDKIYGLRKVYIAAEGSSGAPSASGWKELIVSNIEVPKVFAQDIVVDESSGYRTDTAHLSGNLNELTGTITITCPKNKTFMQSDAMQILLKAAGLEYNSSTKVYQVQNTGACGNTISIYTIDRAGLLAEQLHGCIITSVDATLNRSDSPTLAFAYQAGSKTELWANLDVDGDNFGSLGGEGGTTTTDTGAKFRDGANDTSYTLTAPFYCKILDEEGTDESCTVTAFNTSTGLTYGRPTDSDHSDNTVQIVPVAPTSATAATQPTYCSIRGWNVTNGSGTALDYKLQSASFSFQTGMSYGELIVGKRNLSEVLVGGAELTGTSTVYVDTTVGAANIGSFGSSGIKIVIGEWNVEIPGCYLTETPDLSLAKNEPCSGDLAWKAYANFSTGVSSFMKINCN